MSDDLIASVDQLKKKQPEHLRKKQSQPSKKKKAEVVQLPVWPSHARGVPNSAVRGALFAAIEGKHRQYFHRKTVLATQNGITIRYTGLQLTQTDLDVWEQVIHLARYQPLGHSCVFTAYSLLQSLGRPIGKSSYQWLDETIDRLTACNVWVSDGRVTTFSGLIERGVRDDETKAYKLRLNPDLINLYDGGWSAESWEQRQKLRKKPLALWLHSFYATHAKPYPMKVEKLQKLCGSREKRLRNFKAKLQIALEELKNVGAIRSFTIEEGKVYVDNIPSRSQRRALKKKLNET